MENCLSLFEQGSGLRRNVSKTRFLKIGSVDKLGDLPTHIQASEATVVVLGIPVGNTVTEEQIWEEPTVKAEKSAKIWMARHLSIYGKRLVLNSKILSKLIYRAGLFIIPHKYQIRIEALIKNFLFSFKPAWCSSSPWLEATTCGGLGILKIHEMNCALLAKIGVYLLNGPKKIWSDLAEAEFQGRGTQYLLQPMNMEHKSVNNRLQFWHQVKACLLEIVQVSSTITNECSAVLASPVKGFESLPICIGNLINEKGQWRSQSFNIKINLKISSKIWTALTDSVNKNVAQRISAPKIQIEKTTKIKTVIRVCQANLETYSAKFRFQDKAIDLSKYSTKLGRKILAQRTGSQLQIHHRKYDLNQNELEKLTKISKPKFIPTNLLAFLWKVRHQTLWHPHHQVNCQICKSEFNCIEHILYDCPFATAVWSKAEQRISQQISAPIRKWNPTPEDVLWSHRIYIAAIRKRLWDDFWKSRIDLIETECEDLEFRCHLDAMLYKKYYLD